VAVDDTGRHVFASRIDRANACRCRESLADLGDLPVLDENVGALQRSFTRRHNGRVLDQHIAFRLAKDRHRHAAEQKQK
jgi:hypothetical protein